MSFHSWVTSSLVRHFPLSPAPQTETQPLALAAALNEQMSFQVAMRLDANLGQYAHVAVEGPSGWSIRVRRVGFVPVRHHNTPIEPDAEDIDGWGYIPGYVPDPLFDEDTCFLPVGETHAFWVTVRPAPNADAGQHELKVKVSLEDETTMMHTVQIRLYAITLEKRRDFPITHWLYVDALIDWYKTDLFDARFWEVLPHYVRDVVDHGQDTLYVPVFTPPLDGVKRPSQLLRVTRTGPDAYHFDWRDVKAYVDLAKRSGITNFEWCHLFTQWGAQYALRIYEGQGREERLLWCPETEATSDTYRAFLGQFLPALQRFLSEEGILKQSFFHVSDEPHGEAHLEQYRRVRGLLQDLAPWMRVMDALTDIEYGRQGLTDMPIPSIRTAIDFVQEDIESWCYYCCGPRGQYLNRLLDTPLPKIAMHGFLFYRWPLKGFLHWGYNYWYKRQTRTLIDPYTIQDGLAWQQGWAYGDTFLVYPGADGPIDSIRWEVFAEALQDYTLLQTLGVARDNKIFTPLKSFYEFPKTANWRQEARRKLLETSH